MSGAPNEVLVFSKRFNEFSYGPNHPLKVERLQLTMDLIAAYGLLPSSTEPWVEATPAEERDLLSGFFLSRGPPAVARAALISFEMRYKVHIYYARSRQDIARWVLDRAIKFYKLAREVSS